MSPSIDTKWFLQLNGQIQGPFNNESLKSTLQAIGTENSATAMVWKRGLNEWVYANKWQTIPQTNVPNSSNEKSTPEPNNQENTLFDKTFNQAKNEANLFRVQLNFVDQPPMTKTELMTFIARQEDVSKVSIQDPKSKEWREVYTFPDIVERLGLSRRKQSRVPILAQFVGKSNNITNLACTVITISQGGMGFTENFDLKIGDEVEGQISSPHFFQPISLKADVIYAGTDGYVGLKFSQIHEEAKSAIIDYIKKFGKSSISTP